MRAPSAWNFLGFSRNSLISCSSSTASSTPATSLKHLVHQEDPEPEQEDERQQAREDRPPRRRADALRVEVDVVAQHHLLELRLRLRRRVVDAPLLARDGRAQRLLVRVDRDLADARRAGLHLVVERVGRLLRDLRAMAAERLQGEPDQRCDDDQREERATEKAIHRAPS
jgi:hypothetical protein